MRRLMVGERNKEEKESIMKSDLRKKICAQISVMEYWIQRLRSNHVFKFFDLTRTGRLDPTPSRLR